jgi:hypothetical protein
LSKTANSLIRAAKNPTRKNYSRYNGLERLMLEHRRMIEPAPKPDWNAVRRAAQRTARDIRIMARIIRLRQLAEQTARGELPAPDDDPPKDSDRQ